MLSPEEEAEELAAFERYLEGLRSEVKALESSLEAGCRRFLHHKRAGWTGLVTPSARPDAPQGHWQLTHMDESGPWGHATAPLGPEMARLLFEHGYRA
jgi:hypothetical protein